jgi:hypothetical protein
MIRTETVVVDDAEYYGVITGGKGRLELYRITPDGDQRIIGKEYPNAFLKYMNSLRTTNDKTG